jgi:hypothetical protein
LRLKKVVKYAHLRFVVGTGANLLRNRASELAITGIGVAREVNAGTTLATTASLIA